jgi:uncharacterized protein (TIGR02599 family)
VKRHPSAPAFTLVELLVGTALISLLLVILLGITNQTSSTLRYTRSKVEQFRSARDAFESVTRRLSQATLNTYWDYEYGSGTTAGIPARYVRKSELRFWAGPLTGPTVASGLGTGPSDGQRLGHSVFFQAPLGFVEREEFRGLPNLLNTWGYFVEFDSDARFRPPFLKRLQPPLPERYRFRLMELMQPSDQLSLYATAPDQSGNADPNAPPPWVKTAVNGTVAQPAAIHTLAENIIALVLLPKLSEVDDETGVRLSPSYVYDSTRFVADPEINPKNQLPPLVQVTLVAIDETSAARVENGSTIPTQLSSEELFKTSGASAVNFPQDLEVLTRKLSDARLNYRVFTTDVSIRAAKWSRD